MTFTDGDLKRLSDSVNNPYERPERQKLIRGVIARLEAAENLIMLEHTCEEFHSGPCPKTEAIECWRKAAGK